MVLPLAGTWCLWRGGIGFPQAGSMLLLMLMVSAHSLDHGVKKKKKKEDKMTEKCPALENDYTLLAIYGFDKLMCLLL